MSSPGAPVFREPLGHLRALDDMRSPGTPALRARVGLRPERCLNAIHPGRRCDACRPCPAGAIELRGRPSVDADRCASCGRCVAACPTGAFRSPAPTGVEVCDVSIEARCVEFVCPSRLGRRETRAPRVDAIVEVSCLASLSAELLLALAAEHGSVWLDDSRCAACELASTRGTVAAAVEVARRTLAAWRREGAIRTYAGDAASLERLPHRVRDLGDARPRPTRREFLWPARTRPAEAAHLPTGAALVGRALASLGPPVEPAPLPVERFGRLRVLDSCSACGACAKVCPSGALVATASPSRFHLHLTPAACLGPACGVCALACPTASLSIRAPADPQWLTRARETLAERAVAPCEECHAAVTSQTGDRLCASCRMRRDGRSSLMADILREPRTPR